MIILPIITTPLICFSLKGWENVLFQLGSKRAYVWMWRWQFLFSVRFCSAFCPCSGRKTKIDSPFGIWTAPRLDPTRRKSLGRSSFRGLGRGDVGGRLAPTARVPAKQQFAVSRLFSRLGIPFSFSDPKFLLEFMCYLSSKTP